MGSYLLVTHSLLARQFLKPFTWFEFFETQAGITLYTTAYVGFLISLSAGSGSAPSSLEAITSPGIVIALPMFAMIMLTPSEVEYKLITALQQLKSTPSID